MGYLAGWIGIHMPKMITRNCLEWLMRRHWRQFKKEVAAAVWGAAIYYTWQARNWKIFRNNELSTNYVSAQIKKEIKARIEGISTPSRSSHLSNYFSPLMKFLDSLPACDKVVLVGHELGGFGISKAMESFPEKISVAVFVTALMPGPTLNASTGLLPTVGIGFNDI
ncbi:hypothetical protein HAX54_019134 [Datura stramonium]|uniref:AB hydrolase-1 domain-containing protein n=1 Tax=Datura stramonium TaxID=4076 RepID=A0ABS8UNI2_DATST|nr:hypothetical protein [Datura stramonium]